MNPQLVHAKMDAIINKPEYVNFNLAHTREGEFNKFGACPLIKASNTWNPTGRIIAMRLIDHYGADKNEKTTIKIDVWQRQNVAAEEWKSIKRQLDPERFPAKYSGMSDAHVNEYLTFEYRNVTAFERKFAAALKKRITDLESYRAFNLDCIEDPEDVEHLRKLKPDDFVPLKSLVQFKREKGYLPA